MVHEPMNTFMKRFDATYGPLLGAREPTFRAVMMEAVARNVRSIVETGCARKEGNWGGDGQSTIILDDFARVVGGSFTTIDINPDAIAVASELCPDATFFCEDSVKALAATRNTIDLLYLDSFDVDMAAPYPAAIHCMFEFTSAMKRLHSGSIVFIDDSPANPQLKITGKGLLVAQYMEQRGIRPFTVGYQAAWIMP
jgi:hypothetical protein